MAKSKALAPALAVVTAMLAGFALLPARAGQNQPEPASGLEVRTAVEAKSFLVVAASPLAARAGAAIIREGGSAVDAAVAVQMVLNLVEPQSSGIGGGAFMLGYDRAAGELYGFDGREAAPAATRPELFLSAAGQPLAFDDAVVGGRSVGVPGALRLWQAAHRKAGKLPWARLFQPAIELAEQGFEISPRLAGLIALDRERLGRDATARAYFLNPDGSPRAVGTRLKNPAFAETLRKIAAGGADVFYSGAIARDIVAKVAGFAANPGRLSEDDLKAYAALPREPACAPYRNTLVCGLPPPAGSASVGEMLGLLGHFDLEHVRPLSLEAVHLLAEASKLAFADRDAYLADPETTPVPAAGLADPLYLLVRAQLIDRDRALPVPVRAGNPPWRDARETAPGEAGEFPSTSHFVIVDKAGNVVSATASIEDAFGSRLMVDGFLLNNELTDFSFRPEIGGRPVANRAEPGKRPRSAMAPTIVLDDSNKPMLALGSPGGPRIIDYVAETLVGVLDWGLDIQTAINLPHVANRNGAIELEQGTALAALKPALEALGHAVVLGEMTSGLTGIQLGDGRLTGGADPRREGLAVGE
ncbi:MAG: gamma-glutamyltransferase [Rhodospirillaceae bacterium]